MSSRWIRRRSIIAAILAFLYPGLGHLYLRTWLRAIAWFGLAIVTAMLVIPESAVTAFQNSGIDGLLQASRSFPIEATVSLMLVRMLNVVDAYLTGLRTAGEGPGQTPEGPTCPECGKELDEDLDFCPWCTARLDEYDEEDVDPTVYR